jgi:peptide/nickel transport system permease protein
MTRYVIRRLLFAIPTLVAISLVIFTILYFAPGDPTANLPLNIPQEVREDIRQSLGLGEPFFTRWVKWMQLMFINEPLHFLDEWFGICIGDCENRPRIM